MRRDCEEFIANEFSSCVQNTIQRIAAEDTYRPFHSALLSEEALFWSRFERSFSTSFGQRVIEKISQAAAIAGGADQAVNQQATVFTLYESQLHAIDEHLNALRANARAPDWYTDIAYLASIPLSGMPHDVRVISDLYWKKNGINNYMSIKTVKPNIDQTEAAKRDLLRLKLADPTANVYYGLYYNPFGENKMDYAWAPPKNIFNFNTDPSILIGKEYWDTLGGVGFYEELLAIAQRVGIETRQRIQGLR